jgi:hypothetical protein
MDARLLENDARLNDSRRKQSMTPNTEANFTTWTTRSYSILSATIPLMAIKLTQWIVSSSNFRKIHNEYRTPVRVSARVLFKEAGSRGTQFIPCSAAPE